VNHESSWSVVEIPIAQIEIFVVAEEQEFQQIYEVQPNAPQVGGSSGHQVL
jgi:hypothetical protein